MQLSPPSSRIFNALLSGNIPELLSSSPEDLRPFLPSLARMVVVPTAPVTIGGVPSDWVGQGVGEERKKVIHMLIAGMGEVNAIRSYLKLNFQVKMDLVFQYVKMVNLADYNSKPQKTKY